MHMTNWPTKKLGEVVDFQNGLWVAKKSPSKKVTVLRNTNFRSGGVFDFSNVAMIEVEERQLGSRLLQTGDLLLERSGGGPSQPVGRVMLFNVEGEFSFSNFTTRMRIKDSNETNVIFLWRYLNYLYDSGVTETLQKQTTGIRNLIFSAYKNIEVPLPPVGEQRKIVAKIEKMFAKIDEATRLRTESEVATAALLPAAIHEIFSQAESKGWEIMELGNYIHVQGGFAFKSFEYMRDGIPLIRIQNLQNELVDYTKTVFLSVIKEKEFGRFLLRPRDILVAMSGATTGKMARVGNDSPVAFLNQRVGRFVIKSDKLNTNFLWYFLKSLGDSILENAYGGAQPNISPSKIESIKIPLPPLAEQKEIVKKLDALSEKIRALQALQSAQAADLKALKQSILHQAFSDKL